MKKMTINNILEGTRFAMGLGVGMFVRGICDTVTANESRLVKISYWLSGTAATWALDQAIDNYIDCKAKVRLGILYPDGSLTDEFMNEIINNE